MRAPADRLVTAALWCSLAFVPLVLAIGAQLLGSALGCGVDESGSRPCLVVGIDIGEILSTLFTAGWLSILAAPVMLLALMLWIAVVVRWIAGRVRG